MTVPAEATNKLTSKTIKQLSWFLETYYLGSVFITLNIHKKRDSPLSLRLVDKNLTKHKSHPCEFLPEAEVQPGSRRGDFSALSYVSVTVQYALPLCPRGGSNPTRWTSS